MASGPPNRIPHNEVLISEEALDAKIRSMGRAITDDYQGEELTALVVLKGSFVFASDLLRRIDLPLNVEFIGLRSYGSRTSSSGVVEITMDVQQPLAGKNLLIVEDIIDTGLTISYLKENLATRKPASIRTASLLHKPARTIKPTQIDYLGFEVPDKFVIGYGLDHDGLYRNLPHIATL